MSANHIEQFEKCIEHFKHELSSLRIGRASTGLVQGILVESYGQRLPISHIASINIPDAKTLVIQPWDRSNMAAIEKAIQASNIGLNPVNDGAVIRLSIPLMTEERRKEMVKVVGKLEEQSRIALRNIREEALKEFRAQEESKQITKDDLESSKKKIQEQIDKFNDQVKELAQAKEKEVLTL